MRRLSLIIIFSVVSAVSFAQSLPSNRHTSELTELLERDAISALARQQFVHAFYLVCRKVSADWLERTTEQQRKWTAKNQNHLQVAVAIVDAIGGNIERLQGNAAKQNYLTVVYKFTESAGNSEAARWLQGGSPANTVVPAGESCLRQLTSFELGDSDFSETPEQTIHMRAYASRYFPQLSLR
jgi:hypothetical protein